MSWKSFSGFIILKKYQFASICANGPADLPNWCFNTNKKFISGCDILGFSSPNSHLRVMWCKIDVIYFHQFAVQITISKNLNVDSRLVSLGAPTYSPNWVCFMMLDRRLQIGYIVYPIWETYIPVLNFNKNTGVDSIKRLYTQTFTKYNWCNHKDDNPIIRFILLYFKHKDAFLMMMCPHSCLPVGFLCVRVLFFAHEDEDTAITCIWKQSWHRTKVQVPGSFWSTPDINVFSCTWRHTHPGVLTQGRTSLSNPFLDNDETNPMSHLVQCCPLR